MGFPSVPRVSILICAFNEEATINACLRSALDQVFPSFEVVLVNDGSTDKTRDIAEAISDPRLRTFHQGNQGLVAALNYGLMQCRGEFIARLDADDTCSMDRLARQVQEFETDPDLVLCGTWCYVKYPRGMRICELPAEDAEIKRYLLSDNPFVHSSVMFRRAEVLDIGGYGAVRPCEDYDLWIRLGARGPVKNIPLPLVTRTEDLNIAKRPFYRGLLRGQIYWARLRCQAHAAHVYGVSLLGITMILATLVKVLLSSFATVNAIRDKRSASDLKKEAQIREARCGQPLVSVVIPLYNDKEHIVEAVEAILSQTYKNIEVIIVDDGSTDEGASVVESRFGAKVRLFHQHNSGVAAALNYGIENANGVLIAINDSDDVSDPERVGLQVNALQVDPRLALVGSHAITFDEHGTFLCFNAVPCEPESIEKQKYLRNPFVHSTIMFRREAWREAGGYNPKFLTMQDYELWLRMLRFHRGANINEVCVRRTQRSNSHTRIPKSQSYWRLGCLKMQFALRFHASIKIMVMALINIGTALAFGLIEVASRRTGPARCEDPSW